LILDLIHVQVFASLRPLVDDNFPTEVEFCVEPLRGQWADVMVRGADNTYWYARLLVLLRYQSDEDLSAHDVAFICWYEEQTKTHLCLEIHDGIPLESCLRLLLSSSFDLIPVDSVATRVNMLPDLKGEPGKDFIALNNKKGLFNRLTLDTK